MREKSGRGNAACPEPERRRPGRTQRRDLFASAQRGLKMSSTKKMFSMIYGSVSEFLRSERTAFFVLRCIDVSSFGKKSKMYRKTVDNLLRAMISYIGCEIGLIRQGYSNKEIVCRYRGRRIARRHAPSPGSAVFTASLKCVPEVTGCGAN